MSTGTRQSLLLLCSAGDRDGVERLASRLTNAGLRVAVDVLAEGSPAAEALAAGLARAAVVLLAVSAALQSPLAELLAAEGAESLPPGRWLVLQRDEGEIKGLPTLRGAGPGRWCWCPAATSPDP